MIYGYAHISTDAQDLTSQLAQLKAAGCETIFRKKITGTTADRPQLRKLMAALDHGDVVIIPAVDRLSRDTTDLLVIAREMQRAGAGRRSIAPHQQQEARKRVAGGETQRSVSRSYNVSQASDFEALGLSTAYCQLALIIGPAMCGPAQISIR
jgi:DNA invertase Pin-like site-specific DNA recombinase